VSSQPQSESDSSPIALKDGARVATYIRDLIINLHKRDIGKAGSLAAELAQLLEAQLVARPDQGSSQRVELTIAAIGEARLLLAEDDYGAAAAAAREAAREWRSYSDRVTV
jgi:hypothetical protein